jgi:hypothetical protein
MAAPAKLSPTHEEIMRFVLANPGPRLVTRTAEYFGYTVAWVSTLMNSDAFRAKLATLEREADVAVVADIPAKLRGVAGLALDALAEEVVECTKGGASIIHREFLAETADLALRRLGYGDKAGGTQGPGGPALVQNFLTVDASTLATAQANFGRVIPLPAAPPAVQVSDVQVVEPPEAA